MRISLIHGEDQTKAYNRYQDLISQSRTKGFEIVNITDIKNIVSQSLFEDKTVFILDKPSKIKPNDWKWFAKNASRYNSNLLIFYEGTAPKIILKNLPKAAKKEKFDFPKIIFNFLDSFYPGNSTACLKLLNNLVVNEPIELVFHLLAIRLRELYWIKVSPKTLHLPPWRTRKLAYQASKYSLGHLKQTINNLAEIDIKVKTTSEDLKKALDIIVIKHIK